MTVLISEPAMLYHVITLDESTRMDISSPVTGITCDKGLLLEVHDANLEYYPPPLPAVVISATWRSEDRTPSGTLNMWGYARYGRLGESCVVRGSCVERIAGELLSSSANCSGDA